MSNLVKIVGYAKREFFTDGIEYRNFSPDLVGLQFANSEGTPVFTTANFNISTNLDGKVDKEFVTRPFSDFMSLDTLKLDDQLMAITQRYAKNAKLNLDYTDTTNYALFGSLREFIKSSLENIITNFPASLYITEVDTTDPTSTGDTVSGYSYSILSGASTFTINTDRIENPYELNYLSAGTVNNTFNESNPLRDLNINYASYVVSNTYGDFDVVGFIGSEAVTGSSITLTVKGNPFPNWGSEIINYHIKPNESKREEFFFNLNDFENNLLNRLTVPQYTAKFKEYKETENGVLVETIKELTWVTTDGYNLDFNTTEYANYVTQLLSLAAANDDLKSDLMVRFLVSKSISEFDSIPDINGTYVDTNGQKMTSALKIYGREFDEITKYIHGISYANTVTYDKKNNTPDAVLKNLARILGWELTTSISEIDVLSNFLNLNPNYYGGYSRGYSDAEVEIELWRRIVLNTPWLWKSKGTRKAIEFLFRFIGAPDGLVTFNEYLYVANEPVDMDIVIGMMEFFNNTSDISGLNVDDEGYPRVLPDTAEMYFQKAGLWYRTTGGLNPDIDILEGNNPHIGPYDGGQEYINQFTDCLIPNYVDCDKPTIAEEDICAGYISIDKISAENYQIFEVSGGTTTTVPSVACCEKYGYIDRIINGEVKCRENSFAAEVAVCDGYTPLNTELRGYQVFELSDGSTTTAVETAQCCIQYGFFSVEVNGITRCVANELNSFAAEVADVEPAGPCDPIGYEFIETNIFTNYALGTFDECCSDTKSVDLVTDHDFDGILSDNINSIISSNPVTQTGCTFTNTWTLEAFLGGESFYTNDFFTGATAPTEVDYVNELLTLSGTSELSAATFVYSASTSILTITVDNDCSTTGTTSVIKTDAGSLVDIADVSDYIKVEVCLSTDYDCIDEGVTGLTQFMLSSRDDDGCKPQGALPIDEVFYHDGASYLPQVGDFIYNDQYGLSPAEFPAGEERFMGGDWTDVTNWVQTSASGERLTITCTTVDCLVSTGQAALGASEPSSNNAFWIDGVSQARNSNITFEITGIVNGTSAGSEGLDELTITITDGFSSVVLTESTPQQSVARLISPNGGFNSSGLYDYDALVTVTDQANAVAFNVRMTVTNIDNECFVNTNTQTIAYGGGFGGGGSSGSKPSDDDSGTTITGSTTEPPIFGKA